MHNGSGSTLSTGCEAATALRSRRPSPRVGRSRGGRRPGSRRRCRATRLATRCGRSSTSTRPRFSARVRVPTLLVYGDEDEWIPVDESLAAWREARGDEIDIVIVLGTGHEPAHGEDVSSEYEESLRDVAPRLQPVFELGQRRPARVGLRLAVVVRLVVQVLAADRAETGAVGRGRGSCPAAPARARRAPRRRGRACRPRRRASAALRPRGSFAWYSRAEIGRSSTASSRQRKQGPCRRTWNASSKTVPVDARVIVSSAGTFSGTGR